MESWHPSKFLSTPELHASEASRSELLSTIRFTSQIGGRRERHGGSDPEKTIEAAIAPLMPALLLSSLCIAAGFLVLSISDLGLVRNLGLVTSFVVLLCWLADITLLPALALMDRRPVRTETTMSLAVPGPRSLMPILGPHLSTYRFAREPLSYMGELFSRYGDVVALDRRGGTRIFSSTSACKGTIFGRGPEFLKAVELGSLEYHRSAPSGRLYPIRPTSRRRGLLKHWATGLFAVNNDEHLLHRKILTPAFSPSTHRSMDLRFRRDHRASLRFPGRRAGDRSPRVDARSHNSNRHTVTFR